MINFSKEDIVSFIKGRPILIVAVVVIVLSVGGFLYKNQIVTYFKEEIINYPAVPEVKTPTIIRGDLVLPKVMLDQFGSRSTKDSQIHVVSANLFGVFDSPQDSAQSNPFAPVPEPKLIGIRILGEMLNTGKTIVDEVSPVVRFMDENNNEISTKLGRPSPGFDFFGVLPNSKTVYDVIVDDPPLADKMEIILNVQSATTSGKFELLKVSKQLMDVKMAVNQHPSVGPANNSNLQSGTESGEASLSAKLDVASISGGPVGSEGEIIEVLPEKIEYYTVSGTVVNSLSNPVSDISVYVWIKNSEGLVFSFGRQDFKGDLIAPKKSVEFKINLFPFKDNQEMDKYEIKAWGKRYRL